MMKDYTNKGYWDNVYYNRKLNTNTVDNEVTQKIEELIDFKKINSCFEIGCYPGDFITYFGSKNCTLYGIDFTTKTKQFDKWLMNKYKVGKIWKADFKKFKTDKKFDIVCSFGFIEHFGDYQKIIKKHLDLVDKNGYVIISVPNFRGSFQYVFHSLLDKRNMDMHNLKSMNTADWDILLIKNNFNILFSGPLGGLKFWTDNTGNVFVKIIARTIEKIASELNKLRIKNSVHYSPTLLMIAKKLTA